MYDGVDMRTADSRHEIKFNGKTMRKQTDKHGLKQSEHGRAMKVHDQVIQRILD